MFAYALFLFAVQMLLITNKADVIPGLDTYHPEDNGTSRNDLSDSGNEVVMPHDYVENYEYYGPYYEPIDEDDPNFNSVED